MKNIIRIILITVILVLGYFLITYVINIFDNRQVENTKTVDSIENYGYNLTSRDSKLYNTFFNELKGVLEAVLVDEDKYVSLISKLFIIDFYTLENKLNNKDIGGLEFVHTLITENFKLKAKDTIYKYVKSNLYNNRNQELPVVSGVSVDEVKIITYKLNNYTDDKAYGVKVSMTYDKDLGYETSKTLYFIHEESKLSLVEIK